MSRKIKDILCKVPHDSADLISVQFVRSDSHYKQLSNSNPLDVQHLSRRQRELTPAPFATWLVDLAGRCQPPSCNTGVIFARLDSRVFGGSK